MKSFFLPFLCWIAIKSLSPLTAADACHSNPSNSMANSTNRAQTDQSVAQDLPAISEKIMETIPTQTTLPPSQNTGFFLFWPFRMGFQQIFGVLHKTCIFLGIAKPPRQITYERSEQSSLPTSSALPAVDSTNVIATLEAPSVSPPSHHQQGVTPTDITPPESPTSPPSYQQSTTTDLAPPATTSAEDPTSPPSYQQSTTTELVAPLAATLEDPTSTHLYQNTQTDPFIELYRLFFQSSQKRS